MNKTIFARDKESVKTYAMQINEKKFRKIQRTIDTYFGRGELCKRRSSNLSVIDNPDLIGKK